MKVKPQQRLIDDVEPINDNANNMYVYIELVL
jgi:hypothetical protein